MLWGAPGTGPTQSLPDGGVYKYQIKAWVNSVDATCTGLAANYKDVRATYTATDPQIELTIKNGNPLELAASVHQDLKDILFGFTQATGGATQDITLKNLEMRFIYIYPARFPQHLVKSLGAILLYAASPLHNNFQ